MTLIRVDETYSAKYALQEDTLIKIGQGKDQGCLSETIYRMDPMKKVLTDNFMAARSNMLLFAKGSVGVDLLDLRSTLNSFNCWNILRAA